MKDQIHDIISKALETLGLPVENLSIATPAQESFGDYSTSIALQLAKKEKKNPMEIAEQIVAKIETGNLIEKAEVMKPGFINVWISKKQLIDNLAKTEDIPKYALGSARKVMVEYAHPNTLKLFHIGHLRNITTGETIARILEAVGNTVIRANYQGDVGLHIAKALYGLRKEILENGSEAMKELPLTKRIGLLGKVYAEGNTAYESDETAKQQIIEINRMIYDQNPEIMPLWDLTRAWSLEYFDTIYKRVGTTYDRLYFESEMAKRAIEIANKAVKEGILEISDGAIVLSGEKHGVHTRVFVNSLGFPTYEGKELPLAEKETTEHGSLDRIIHVVAAEQTSFFKTTFKAEELINPQIKGIQYHLVYGWVDVKGSKMSSRKGNVVQGAWLLDEAKKGIISEYKSSEEVAEKLAVAAVKYSFLKNGIASDVQFDLEDAITLQGDSGPYLVYTYVRCKSILNKSNMDPSVKPQDDSNLNEEELAILRTLSKYPEIVADAAKNFAPNYITTYLYDLSQKYNLFYQKHQILKEENEEVKSLRLKLTEKTSDVIKHGLNLLGIETVEKM